MSASSPPSTMLRAATATSGGTDAPEFTYCSIWPWIEAMSASISSVLAWLSSMTSTRRLEMRIGLEQVEQPDAALALDDGADRPVLETDDLRDLRQGADGVQLVDARDVLLLGGALGHERDRLRGADGAIERLHAPIAADLERHDHLREDHRVAQGDERQHLEPLELGAVLLGRLVGRVLVRGLVVSCHSGSLLQPDRRRARPRRAPSAKRSISSSSNRS
jgi:hypothetical protein